MMNCLEIIDTSTMDDRPMNELRVLYVILELKSLPDVWESFYIAVVKMGTRIW